MPINPMQAGGIGLIIMLVVAAAVIFAMWRILQRAGFNPWLSLLILVPPVGGAAVIAMLAFRTWPTGEAAVHSTFQDVVKQVQGGR